MIHTPVTTVRPRTRPQKAIGDGNLHNPLGEESLDPTEALYQRKRAGLRLVTATFTTPRVVVEDGGADPEEELGSGR
jgi:hypothetical protein